MDSAAIAGGITGAGPKTFLLEFTDIKAKLAGPISAWHAEPDGEKKIVKGQEVRRTKLSYSAELKRTLDTVLNGKETSRREDPAARRRRAAERVSLYRITWKETGNATQTGTFWSRFRGLVPAKTSAVSGIPSPSLSFWNGSVPLANSCSLNLVLVWLVWLGQFANE